MIEAHELTKRYRDTTAVHALSFTIAPGTVTVDGKPYRQHRAPLREVGALLEARAVLFAYFVIGVVVNRGQPISRSRGRRLVMTPTCAVLAVCTLLVAIGWPFCRGERPTATSTRPIRMFHGLAPLAVGRLFTRLRTSFWSWYDAAPSRRCAQQPSRRS